MTLMFRVSAYENRKELIRKTIKVPSNFGWNNWVREERKLIDANLKVINKKEASPD